MIAMLGLACGPAAQQQDEATITYKVKFVSSQPVNTRVIFPLPDDGAQMAVMNGLFAADGGAVAYVQLTEGGVGTALDGLGMAEASYFVKNLKGLDGGSGPPGASLSMRTDAGPNGYFVQVNKAGAGIVNIEFEYTASRDCGSGCGGKKSWKFAGEVGLAKQPIQMDYVEEKR